MSREILVIKRDILFKDKEFLGFCPISEKDFSNIILENFEFQERSNIEEDPTFQQPIPYVWMVNPKTKQIFIYKRSKEGGEGRLYDKYSGGVGGHIDRDTEESSENPIVDAMMRELKEEILMTSYPTPKFVGFINDNSTEVAKVHFGIVAIAESEEDIKPLMHMAEGKLHSVQEIEELFSNPENDVESWTQISWPFVKKYIESLPN